MAERLAWTREAWADYLYWQSQDRKTLRRINRLAIVDSVADANVDNNLFNSRRHHSVFVPELLVQLAAHFIAVKRFETRLVIRCFSHR